MLSVVSTIIWTVMLFNIHFIIFSVSASVTQLVECSNFTVYNCKMANLVSEMSGVQISPEALNFVKFLYFVYLIYI